MEVYDGYMRLSNANMTGGNFEYFYVSGDVHGANLLLKKQNDVAVLWANNYGVGGEGTSGMLDEYDNEHYMGFDVSGDKFVVYSSRASSDLFEISREWIWDSETESDLPKIHTRFVSDTFEFSIQKTKPDAQIEDRENTIVENNCRAWYNEINSTLNFTVNIGGVYKTATIALAA